MEGRKLEIANFELEGRNKNLENELALWKDRYNKCDEDRNRLSLELREALEKINSF